MDKNPIEMLKELAELEDKNLVQPTLVERYMELFLEIAVKIRKDVFLKGNVLLNQICRNTARGTKDLDMSVISTELYDTVILPELIKFGDTLVSNGLAEFYQVKNIQPKMSGGIDVKDGQNHTLYSVDVSLSDIHPLGVVEYTFGGYVVYGSSIEKILADKCLSTLSRKRFRRIKDFYDIYIILDSEVGYDVSSVLELMISKVGREEVISLLNNQPFTREVIEQVVKSWNTLVLIRDLDGSKIDKPNFQSVIDKVYILYDRISIKV